MANVTVRNRNAGKFDKEGRKKQPNWEYRFDTAKINGKRKQVQKGGFKTKSEAVAAGNAALASYNATGATFTPSEMSVSDYLDYWISSYIKPTMAYNTYIDYERTVRVHLKPAFGFYKLSALSNNPAAVQEWITSMKTRGYSRNMVKNTLSCLSGALNYAVNPCKYISQNPCVYVKTPKITESKERKAHNEYICSAEEFNKIIERFDESSNFYQPLMLGYYLGTRLGEAYGIDLLNDVDFENNIVHINRQMSKQENKWILKSPKFNSVRSVKVTKNIIDMLKKDKLEQQKNMLKYGKYYIKSYVDENNSIVQLPASVDCALKPYMPICVKENGELLTTDSFKYCAKVIHYELGLAYFHSHCLRHTHGTILAENGVHPKTVMERLGHKDISTTLQIYTFNTEKMQDKCVEILEKIAHN